MGSRVPPHEFGLLDTCFPYSRGCPENKKQITIPNLGACLSMPPDSSLSGSDQRHDFLYGRETQDHYNPMCDHSCMRAPHSKPICGASGCSLNTLLRLRRPLRRRSNYQGVLPPRPASPLRWSTRASTLGSALLAPENASVATVLLVGIWRLCTFVFHRSSTASHGKMAS